MALVPASVMRQRRSSRHGTDTATGSVRTSIFNAEATALGSTTNRLNVELVRNANHTPGSTLKSAGGVYLDLAGHLRDELRNTFRHPVSPGAGRIGLMYVGLLQAVERRQRIVLGSGRHAPGADRGADQQRRLLNALQPVAKQPAVEGQQSQPLGATGGGWNAADVFGAQAEPVEVLTGLFSGAQAKGVEFHLAVSPSGKLPDLMPYRRDVWGQRGPSRADFWPKGGGRRKPGPPPQRNRRSPTRPGKGTPFGRKNFRATPLPAAVRRKFSPVWPSASR